MDQEIIRAFAPTGSLRASINTGNAVLAKAGDPGQAAGVSVDIAGELARRLGVELELVVFDKAALSVEAIETNVADIGFFAIDPKRARDISFTHPYVLIEGAYVVRDDSPITDNNMVDASGNRVVVGKGSAYDLYLTRTLKRAELVRAASSQEVVRDFLEMGAEVAAGVKQQLELDLRSQTGLRMLPGRFMEIRQAMGMNKSRGEQAAAFLRIFVENLKARGFVKEALERHGIQGAGVANALDPDLDPLKVE